MAQAHHLEARGSRLTVRLELNLEESGPLSLESTPEQAADLAAEVRNAGLEIPSLATGLYWKTTNPRL